jgi:hypothetical protein
MVTRQLTVCVENPVQKMKIEISVEEIISNLASLRNSLPVNCTRLNVQKLKLKFLEYKYISGLIPENYSGMKDQTVQKFELVQSKIDAIDDTSSPKAMKMIFQEAAGLLKAEIDALHLKLLFEKVKNNG